MTRSTIKCLLSIMLMSVATGYAAPSSSVYSHYQEKPKTLTELEWRLLLVRVKTKVLDINYDGPSDTFIAIQTVLTTDMELPTKELRYFLESHAGLVSSTLEYGFPEFSKRGGRDLRMEFRVGRKNFDLIAVYKDNKLEFTKEYYDYLREIRR